MVEVFKMKQEWEDDITEEREARIKIGLKERCMSCHKELKTCGCIHPQNKTSTYWGF
tara:strand:- start:364 stop:534 length:171 start_codon:yes stop_codon:yes gene_type:complete